MVRLGLVVGIAAFALFAGERSADAARIDGPGEAVVAVLACDVVLFVGDLRTAPAPTDWAVGETILGVPQAAIFGGLAVSLATDRSSDRALLQVTTGFTVFTGALATHGIWSLANREKSSRDALGVSLVGSIDATLLGLLLTADVAGDSRDLATAAIVTSVPTTIASSVGLALDDAHRQGWVALTIASSALLTHGIVSTFLEREAEPPRSQAHFGPTWIRSADAHGTLAFAWSGVF